MSSRYIGGLKVAAAVTGLSVREQTVAVAVSRLEGDVWDGCVEVGPPKLSNLFEE